MIQDATKRYPSIPLQKRLEEAKRRAEWIVRIRRDPGPNFELRELVKTTILEEDPPLG